MCFLGIIHLFYKLIFKLNCIIIQYIKKEQEYIFLSSCPDIFFNQNALNVSYFAIALLTNGNLIIRSLSISIMLKSLLAAPEG